MPPNSERGTAEPQAQDGAPQLVNTSGQHDWRNNLQKQSLLEHQLVTVNAHLTCSSRSPVPFP